MDSHVVYRTIEKWWENDKKMVRKLRPMIT